MSNMVRIDRKYKLIIFDLDGTLQDRDTEEILPGVKAWFETWDRENCQVMIATNQGGVGLRYWMETGGFGEPEKYPTEADVWERIAGLKLALSPKIYGDAAIFVFAAFRYQSKKGQWSPVPDGYSLAGMWKMIWRKPHPGMLIECMETADVLPDETLMVGDSDDDRGAAKAAGCDFMDADEFFGRATEPVETER